MFWKRKDKNNSEDEQPGEPAAAENGAETAEGSPDDSAAAEEAVERVVTSGTFEFEGEEHAVTNNTWIIDAGEDGVVVIDPAHDAEPIIEAVGERDILLVACTNGYRPHIASAVEVAEHGDASIALHRREQRSWRKTHGVERKPDLEIEGGGTLHVGALEIRILAVPGTAPGSVAYYVEKLNAVFSGDTLLAGSLGTVGEGYVDYTTQLASVGETLLSLPPETRVLPDRGEETTVLAESENFDDWVAG